MTGTEFTHRVPSPLGEITLRENPLLSYDIIECAGKVMENRETIVRELSGTAVRMRALCREDMENIKRLLEGE